MEINLVRSHNACTFNFRRETAANNLSTNKIQNGTSSTIYQLTTFCYIYFLGSYSGFQKPTFLGTKIEFILQFICNFPELLLRNQWVSKSENHNPLTLLLSSLFLDIFFLFSIQFFPFCKIIRRQRHHTQGKFDQNGRKKTGVQNEREREREQEIASSTNQKTRFFLLRITQFFDIF